MSGGVRYRHLRRHRSRPLVVRGSLGRTFGGLAWFAAILFLLLGIYILDDALANPVAAETAAIITAACSISLAAIMLFYLVKPTRRRFRGSAYLEVVEEVSPEKATIQAKVPGPKKKARSDLAQWVYVDTSRFLPRART
jgi:hypothetical protein